MMKPDKMTAPKITNKKRLNEKIVALTAYDYPTALLADASGVDLILVGDSIGNVVLGFNNTLPVDMDDMIRATSAVRRGVKSALLVADMPFMSYHVSADKAVENACRLIKAGAESIKLEGGKSVAPIIERLTDIGIPVLAHVGMTPQSVNQYGGYRVQGRGAQADLVEEDALAVQSAGAYAVVVELVPSVVAQKITNRLSIPTIGIGAGPYCNGEIQVFHDIVGLSEGEPLKHTKRFAEVGKAIREALANYASAVRNSDFPTDENSF